MQGEPTRDSESGTRDSIAARLRAETRAEHERVEALVDLMRPDLTEARYAAWVARFWGYIAPWEARVWPVLAGAVPEVTDLEARRKTPLLEKDLAQLFPTGTSGISRCPRLPELGNVPRALGSLYVLEGATLGGQHISRHVRQVLGRDATSGCAYFHGYGDRTGPMWRAFALLLSRCSSPTADDQIVAAARETFATMADWLASTAQDLDGDR